MKPSLRIDASTILTGLLLLAALIAPIFIGNNSYLVHIFVLIFIFIVFGEAWNLLAGFAGQVSLGHNVFFGTGAYASALLVYYFDMNPWATLIAGGVFSMLLAIPIGLICFRLRGAYFALATLALSEVVRLVIMNWTDVTRGGLGVVIPVPQPIQIGSFIIDFHSKIPYYYMALVITIATIYITNKIVRSRYGFKLLTIREDEDAASSLGVNALKLKLFALIVSTFIAGLIGAFYAQYILYVDPTTDPGAVLSPFLGLDAILVGLIGGVGTVFGPVIGGILRQGLGEYLRMNFGWTGGLDLFIFGVILILMVLFLPHGIWGTLRRRYPLNRLVKARR